MTEARIFALNAARHIEESETVGLLEVNRVIPLAASSVQGVAIDPSFPAEILSSAIKVVRPGGRIVAPAAIEPPAEHHGCSGLGDVEKCPGPRRQIFAFPHRRRISRDFRCSGTSAEPANAFADPILRRTSRAAERAFQHEPVGDAPERRHEPGLLVRVDAAQQVEELDEHPWLFWRGRCPC